MIATVETELSPVTSTVPEVTLASPILSSDAKFKEAQAEAMINGTLVEVRSTQGMCIVHV